MRTQPSLLICGASARAAAQSAQKIGLEVLAADLFCDVDLQQCALAFRSRCYPNDLAGIADRLPVSNWLYTGGLENRPALVRCISQRHHLLGNGEETLRRARNPWQLARACQSAGLHYPPPRTGSDLPSGTTWLEKPLAGCGGNGVRRVTPKRHSVDTITARSNSNTREPGSTSSIAANQPQFYYQPFISGKPFSANFVAADGYAELLGVTRQLVGTGWTGAAEFHYAGSIGPVTLDEKQLAVWRSIGSCLAKQFRLQGLFGVDAIVSGDDIWTVELNPRFCASLEILERALSLRAVGIHIDACCAGALPSMPSSSPDTVHGKAILFAKHPMNVATRHVEQWLSANQAATNPRLADIPQPDTSINTGHPILTIFAEGKSEQEVLIELRTVATDVRKELE